MVSRHNKGIGASASSTTSNSHTSHTNKFSARKYKWLKPILLASSIPFAVLSGGAMKAEASVFSEVADSIKEIKDKAESAEEKIVNTIAFAEKVINWFKNIKENIAEMSINLVTWSFDFITSIVLHTPTFLFDSEWFRQNTLTFTGLSIAMSMVLAVYEGFQRMMGDFIKRKNPTEIGRILKRMPLVVVGSALAPSAFYYAFKGINYITDLIINIGKTQMGNSISNLGFNDITTLEVLTFIAFDIALIGMMIPVFLQNFRRWADLLMLGAITPLALSCWVFKSHEHLFNMWWTTIKKSSFTQLVYATFLLIIGTLMFGTKTPDSELDVMVKIGIVIGCLWRMNTLPSFVRGHVDHGKDISQVWKEVGNSVTPHKWLIRGGGIFRGGFNAIRSRFSRG